MADPPRRALPSSAGDAPLRRLGVGRASADWPLRGQVVVALVLGLIVLAIPLYVLRRPPLDSAPAPQRSAEPRVKPSRGIVRSRLDAGRPQPRLQLAEVQRVKCSAGPRLRGNEGPQCDALTTLEDALKKTIAAQVECAPQMGGGSINFVLNVDFSAKRVSVFPGQSGSWKGPQAKRAAQCVEQALPPIRWETIAHQYRFYTLAIRATYSGQEPVDIMPTFE